MAAIAATTIGAGVIAGGASIYNAKKARDQANKSAAAAGQAAQDQEAAAQRNFDFINKEGLTLQNQVMNEAKQYSVKELQALDQSLALQGRNIQGQEKLMSAIDPTLIEASQQALKLLRGENASSLAPLNAQQATQRQALVNQLRSQGIGENSSAGQQALSRFDQGAAMTANNAQQQQLGTLLGTTLNSRVDLGASAGQLAGLGQQYGNIGARNANLLAATGNTRLGALTGAGQSLIGAAGSQYTGAVLAGQAGANYYNQQGQAWGNMAGSIGGVFAGSYANGGLGGGNAAAGANTFAPKTTTGGSYQNYGGFA